MLSEGCGAKLTCKESGGSYDEDTDSNADDDDQCGSS